MLLDIFKLLGSLVGFGIIIAVVFGFIGYRLRINKSGVHNDLSLKPSHIVYIVFAGVLSAMLYMFLVSYNIHQSASAYFKETSLLTFVAKRQSRPTDIESLKLWSNEKLVKAFADSDKQGWAARERDNFLNKLVVGNANNDSPIPNDHEMIKLLANAQRFGTYSDAPSMLVAMMVMKSNGLNCLGNEAIKADATSCINLLSNENTQLSYQQIMDYLEKAIVPDIWHSSLFGADAKVPNAKTIRYKLFAMSMMNDVQTLPNTQTGTKAATKAASDIVTKYVAYLEEKGDSAMEDVKIIEGLTKIMVESVQDHTRLLMMIWGPIQLFIIILFFCSSIICVERIFQFHNTEHGLMKFLKQEKERQLTKEDVTVEFKEVVYTPVNYILWALPTLGFIGTVTGISSAIADAYLVAENIDPIGQGEAIKWVTSLLGVAFDTTFVALVCSLPLMALASYIRSKEASSINTVFSAGTIMEAK